MNASSSSDVPALRNTRSDESSSLSFLKISSMQWLPKVEFPLPLRPVLERAWLHYAIRKEQASPVAFLEWITLMRGKLVRTGSTTYMFTTEHFDLLNRLLVNYLTGHRISDGTAATMVPKQSTRVKVSGPKSVEMDLDANEGSKPTKGNKAVTPVTTPVEVADSSPVKGHKRPSHEPAVKTKVKKTKAVITPKPKVINAMEQCRPDTEHQVEPPSPESHSSNVDLPVVNSDYVQYVAPLQPSKADDLESVATLDTLKDAAIDDRKRLKRAVYRFLLCNRKCTCATYKSAAEDMSNISQSVESYLDSLPHDDHIDMIGASECARECYLELLKYVPCQACAIAVGQGFGLFLWTITHRIYS